MTANNLRSWHGSSMIRTVAVGVGFSTVDNFANTLSVHVCRFPAYPKAMLHIPSIQALAVALCSLRSKHF